MSEVERRRTLLVAMLALLVAAGVGFVAARQMRAGAVARATLPAAEGRVPVEGLTAVVEIHRDQRGFPHIEAQTELDGFYGLGFAHAQDRLGQMLWLVRSARGRTAEVVGREGLPADRLARTLDLGGLADAEYEALDAVTRRALDAYAAGVNARITTLRASRGGATVRVAPLGLPLEDWAPADSLAVFKLYSWGLSGTVDVSLVLSELIDRMGGFAAGPFFPRRPGDDLLQPPPSSKTARIEDDGPSAARRLDALVPDPLRRAAGLEGRAAGSSAWVLGGLHTESGLPVLAADAHLEPTAPPFLHVAHVRGGQLDLAGATIPGLPVVWTGHNGRVAWAATSARAVTCDLFEEKLHPSGDGRYHDGKGWSELETRVETIAVNGADAEELVVRSTHHGPLVDALLDDDAEDGLALTWVGGRTRRVSGVATLLAAARAGDAAEFQASLGAHEEPVLAVAYADREGAAGMRVAGWIPLRTLPTDLQPVPGRAGWYDWRERIPYDDLPSASLEDGAGWIVVADDGLGDEEQAKGVEWLWRTGARAGRIDALLRATVAAGPVRLRSVARLQADVGVDRSAEILRLALEQAGDDPPLRVEAREVTALLDEWNGDAAAGSAGAAAYHVFLDGLTETLLQPSLGESLFERYLALPQTDPSQVVLELLRAGPGDAAGAERRRRAIRESLRETWFELSYRLGSNRGKWHWGSLHRLHFRSFGLPSGVRGDAGLGPFGYGGNGSTVGAAEYDPASSFDVRLASTFRFAVDASALDQALVALAPGESEHPGHPHFDDGLEPWLAGQARLFATSRLLVEESSSAQLVLEPAP